MKLTFRQLVYYIVLFAVVIFGIATCSKQLVVPIFTENPQYTDAIVFQKSQEENVESNVQSLLNKIVGKNTHFVSVMMTMQESDISEEEIQLDPKIVTQNTLFEKNDETKNLRKSTLNRRPLSNSVQSYIRGQENLLPGLVSKYDTQLDKNPLPGFPVVKNRSTVVQPEYDLDETEGGLLEPQLKDLSLLNTLRQENVVYYDEKKTTTITPRTTIDRVFVSVVIDEDHFKLLEIKKNIVESLILDVAGLDLEKGDQLEVSYMPFVEKSFDFQRFYIKNKPMISKIMMVLDKVKWVFIGLLALLAIAVLGWLTFRYIKKEMAERERMRLESIKNQKTESQEIFQKKKDKLEEKRKAIEGLAKSKPEDFASLVLNWIEAVEEAPRG